MLRKKKSATADSYDDLHQSYGRCMNNGRFIERFYDIFLASHPEVRNAFANTDFDRQRRLLRRTLTNSIMYAAGSESVSIEVSRMAQVHSRTGKAPVQPHLYSYWLDSLIATIKEHDPECDRLLEKRWRDAMSKVIGHFSQNY